MGDELETIVAVATPPGRGGIGVVRVSGAGARACVEGLVRVGTPLAHGVARFGHVVDEGGRALDEAVVTYFEGPRSYTAEDVVEVSAHGAPVLLEYLVKGAMARGARLAEPGEFTQRAFLAGRLDLTQAEAVQDLIAARTLEQARMAAAQLGGAVSRAVGPVKQLLIELIAQLEAGVDFAEDDLDLLPEAEIAGRIAGVMEPLEKLAASYEYGRVLREGLVLAIVGRPNAGKSSLFNRLLGRERAIVTAQAGTTRDSIEEGVELAGIPVTLVDTAGLREMVVAPETEAEREGIARSRVTMAEADLVVQVVDATTLVDGELTAEDAATWEGLAGRARLLVVNKSDLAAVAGAGLGTSAVTGEGLDELRRAIVAAVAGRGSGDSAMVTNLRQAGVLGEAVAALAKARAGAGDGVPHEFLLLDLHEGLGALDRLTGVTTAEDVLRVIFSSFCIGK